MARFCSSHFFSSMSPSCGCRPRQHGRLPDAFCPNASTREREGQAAADALDEHILRPGALAELEHLQDG